LRGGLILVSLLAAFMLGALFGALVMAALLVGRI